MAAACWREFAEYSARRTKRSDRTARQWVAKRGSGSQACVPERAHDFPPAVERTAKTVEFRLADSRCSAVLRDGTAVCARAIRPDDKERLRAAFARLSPRSVYQRFFHPRTELTSNDLRRLTEIDFRDHVGLVLTIGEGSDERLIAVGRYVRVRSGADRAEVAFAVIDEYQRRGAATLLLQRLVGIARHVGVRSFVASVLMDNDDMLEVFRHSKLALQQSFVDGARRVVLSLDGDSHAIATFP